MADMVELIKQMDRWYYRDITKVLMVVQAGVMAFKRHKTEKQTTSGESSCEQHSPTRSPPKFYIGSSSSSVQSMLNELRTEEEHPLSEGPCRRSACGKSRKDSGGDTDSGVNSSFSDVPKEDSCSSSPRRRLSLPSPVEFNIVAAGRCSTPIDSDDSEEHRPLERLAFENPLFEDRSSEFNDLSLEKSFVGLLKLPWSRRTPQSNSSKANETSEYSSEEEESNEGVQAEEEGDSEQQVPVETEESPEQKNSGEIGEQTPTSSNDADQQPSSSNNGNPDECVSSSSVAHSENPKQLHHPSDERNRRLRRFGASLERYCAAKHAEEARKRVEETIKARAETEMQMNEEQSQSQVDDEKNVANVDEVNEKLESVLLIEKPIATDPEELKRLMIIQLAKNQLIAKSIMKFVPKSLDDDPEDSSADKENRNGRGKDCE